MKNKKKNYGMIRMLITFIAVFVSAILVTLIVPNSFAYKQLVYYGAIIIAGVSAPLIADKIIKKKARSNKQ